MSVKENLLAAADVVENGWCVGYLVQDGDKYCAVGALAKVLTGSDAVLRTADAYDIVKGSPEGKILADTINAESYGEDGVGFWTDLIEVGRYDDVIYDFNDSQESKDVVIEAMRKAAVRAED